MTPEERINEEDAQWLAFGRTMEMVLDYDDAFNRCLEFIFRHGLPECSIPMVRSNDEITSSAYTKLLLSHLEGKEDYENCGRLVACKASEPDTDFTDFLVDAQVVASFEINCNKCQEVITDIDIFYEVQHPRDYVRLMDILIDHFQGRLNHEQMETLHEVRATVIFDIKGEPIQATIPNTSFIHLPRKAKGMVQTYSRLIMLSMNMTCKHFYVKQGKVAIENWLPRKSTSPTACLAYLP